MRVPAAVDAPEATTVPSNRLTSNSKSKTAVSPPLLSSISARNLIFFSALPLASYRKAISVSAKVQGPVRFQAPWVRLVAVLGEVKLTVPSAGPPLYVPKKIAPLLSTTSQLPTIDLQLAADTG